MHHTLAQNFLQYFDVTCAGDDETQRKVFSIRYNVYCAEFGYEPADAFPDRMERDEYDASSLHALVTHKSSGLPAGCVRLVSSPPAAPDTRLPFEKFCSASLDQDFIHRLNLDRGAMCEISRLAVDGAFRRRPGESVTRFGEVEGLDCTQQERRTFSLIAVACFLAATAMTDLSARRSVFAMMEPFLPRLLQRSGIGFQRAGEDIDYHGLRAPYYTTTQSVIEGMRPDLRELYQEIHRNMQASFPA